MQSFKVWQVLPICSTCFLFLLHILCKKHQTSLDTEKESGAAF